MPTKDLEMKYHCPTCDGYGVHNGERCKTCGGKQFLTHDELLEVRKDLKDES